MLSLLMMWVHIGCACTSCFIFHYQVSHGQIMSNCSLISTKLDWSELSWPATNFPLSTISVVHSVGIVCCEENAGQSVPFTITLVFHISNQATLALSFLWREIFGCVPLSAYAELSSWDSSSDLTLTKISHVFPFLCFPVWRASVSSQPAFWWLLILRLKLAVICMGFSKSNLLFIFPFRYFFLLIVN